MTKELDCRGLQCPEPVVRCRALVTAENPAHILIIVDNAAAVENVSRFLKRNGYIASAEKTSDIEWRISGKRESESSLENVVAPEKTASKTLVLLTTEMLGRGDDELGSKLMDMFLANLSELGDSLWRVILLNGAVKLCAREGKALESLKSLANSGVGIFVCGTCLMHYGLLEQKQIGDTTNMMDIISSLSLAEKIIRP